MSSLSPSQKREKLAEMLRQRSQQQLRRFPLSFAQQRLWLLNEMEGGNTIAYNIPVALRLQGRLDLAALERCFNEIVRRHDALRTTFDINSLSGAPEQIIHPFKPFSLEVVEVAGSNEDEQEQNMRRLASEHNQLPFNIKTGPLIRAVLLRMADDKNVLVILMHHIVSDGWSVGLIIKELVALYEAYSQGSDRSPLPDLPIQYADFAHWQRAVMTSEMLERQLEYWRHQLKAPLPVLELPSASARPARYSTNGAVRVWRMPPSLTHHLKALSQRESATLFMTLLAAFKLLLYRYTSQLDLLVGTPMAGRNRSEVESLIGVFINTLVLRTRLEPTQSFRQLLANVKEVALEAFANQDVPFEKLVEELGAQRDLSRPALFQVMFVLQNAPMPAFKMADLIMSPMVIEGVTSKFDMTLSIMEEEDGALLGWLECNADVFDEPMMRRLMGHYETLLKAVIAAPDDRISHLPILTEAERRQLLFDWNNTQGDYSLDLCMHELFEAQVSRAPQATAVIFEDQLLTYQELNNRANQLAWFLRGRGIGQETLVGISMERSLELIIAMLGVLKAGAAYVPLDPTYPKERLEFMIEDASVKFVLTQAHLAPDSDQGGQFLCLDTGWDEVAPAQAEKPIGDQNLDTAIGPQNLAYIIYTSGSTGKPKGVMTSHEAMVNMILWMQSAYPLTETDILLQKTSFSFDASVWEFYWPLVTGAMLAVARPYGDKDGAYMVNAVYEEGVTILQMVPSVLQIVEEQEGFEKCLSLRHVFSGGEALSAAVREKFFERLRETRLTNVYGPTETAMHVTIWDCERDSQLKAVPIGRPVGNTQTFVLDEQMEPVPVAVAGELYIAGAQVARGYVNRPELTAERFVPNPNGRKPGERMYRTGDLARYRTDGGIEFLGRIDHQVKIRGYRIELGEIEAVLRRHSGVLEGIVMAREDTPGDKRLVAYVVPRPSQELKISEVRNHLLTQLPDYMIPSAFVLLEKLPLMSSGKVDRHLLPQPEYTRKELEQDYVAPRNEVEEKLAAIISSVLGVEKVGAEDSFFLLGGHSLTATQVITHIRDVLKVEIPLRRIFETPTVAGLALAVEQCQVTSEEDRIEIISRPATPEAEPLESLLGQFSSEELQALLTELAARKQK